MSPRSNHRAGPSASRVPVNPVYRGPQAVARGSAPADSHAPNAALLIDFDNVTMGIRSDLQSELKNLLSSEIVKGKVSVQRAYADWRRYPQYIVPLTEASIDLIYAVAYGSAKKNATDIRLAIDAMEIVFTRPEIGTIILLSGDSDFSSLVIKLKEYGKYVIGVGIRESSSDLLVMNCDEYYSYNALAGLVRAGDEEIVPRDPWELVTEAVTHMKKNGDVMRADRLKQVMQQMDSSFDEKNLGMSKFSRFVTEAAQRKLLVLKKLDNGQIEIDTPSAPIHARAGTPPAAPAKREEERPRRGRGSRSRRGSKEGGAAPSAAQPELASQSAPAQDVAEQLRIAATARAAESKDALPRGIAPRGVGRGRGFGRGAPPANLLSVGVVEVQPLSPAAAAPAENGESPGAAEGSDALKRGRRGRGTVRRRGAKAGSAAKTDAPRAKRAPAAKNPDGAPRRSRGRKRKPAAAGESAVESGGES